MLFLLQLLLNQGIWLVIPRIRVSWQERCVVPWSTQKPQRQNRIQILFARTPARKMFATGLSALGVS